MATSVKIIVEKLTQKVVVAGDSVTLRPVVAPVTVAINASAEPIKLKIVNGTSGVDGKSAYDIAVNNGFVGSEAAWLTSLKGAKGDTGNPGQSFSLLGSVDESGSLTTIDTPTNGDGYITNDTGHLWVYTGPDPNDDVSKWSDVGTIVGPQGAQGLPGTLDQMSANPTEAQVKAFIQSAYTRGFTLLPRGDFKFTDTLAMLNKIGLTIFGAGSQHNENPLNANAGSYTNIYGGAGITGKPLLKIRGARNHWANIQFSGDKWDLSGGTKPSALVLVSRGSDLGTGSGKHEFNNVTFLGPAGAGIQFGESVTEGNCDLCTITHGLFRSLDKGLYVKNQNGMSYLVEHPTWEASSDSSSFFYFEAGGSLEVIRAAVVDRCNVLTLDQLDDEITSQRGGFYFTGMKIDFVALGTCLLNCIENAQSTTNDLDTQVVFRNCDISGANSYYPADAWQLLLGFGIAVKFEDCQFNHNMLRLDGSPIIGWKPTPGRPTQLVYDHCFFRHTITQHEPTKMMVPELFEGDIELIVRDCYNFTDWIDDFKGTIVGEA